MCSVHPPAPLATDVHRRCLLVWYNIGAHGRRMRRNFRLILIGFYTPLLLIPLKEWRI